jgi:hypothetical protein
VLLGETLWLGLAFVAQGRARLRAITRKHEFQGSAFALAEERGEPPQQAYALKLLGDVICEG